ncbi:MAG TPA: metallophosphoesterase [Blastocatellia bacterium]|nr:metallophosphoesterase [Blastocatellia bacterium]
MADAVILGFAGKIGSGKSTLSSKVAEALGWPYVSFGDYVRSVARQRGLEESRRTLQEIGESLINEGCDEFCRTVLGQADWIPGQSLIVDGLRHAEIVNVLRRIVFPSQLYIIYIEVTEGLRASRLSERNEDAKQPGLIDSHSTEAQVQSVLPGISDLFVDGNKPLDLLVDEVLSWASKRIEVRTAGSGRGYSKMTGLTWLHLSDWHQKGKDFDREVVRDLLMRDIHDRTKISPELEKIDFIIFSGDLAYHGKSIEYTAAIEHLFAPLLEATGLGDAGRERLFIVPGNHDVDRDALEILSEKLLDKLSNSEAVAHWLTDDRKRRALLEPLTDYRNFAAEYLGGYQDFKDYDLAYWYLRRLTVENKVVSILCLNSAWLTGHNKDSKGRVNDRGYLILGEPQIHRALEQSANADVRIVVLHHPFEWLNEFDRLRVEDRLTKECHFILCGHQHFPQIKIVHGPNSNYVHIPAGASYDRRVPDDPRYTNSYNFVHLDFDSGQGTIFLRRWSDQRTEWVSDQDSAKDGRYSFTLPKRLGKKEEQGKNKLVSPSKHMPLQAQRTKPFEQFQTDVHEWLKVCGHQVESYIDAEAGSFQFILNEPITGGYDRVLVYGIQGEATVADAQKLRLAVEKQGTHRGWLLSMRHITPAARQSIKGDARLQCYTFDELVDQNANFDKYFTWMEAEVQRKQVSRYYIDLGCTKDDIDPATGERLGISDYDRIDDYIDQWLEDPSAEHISVLGEFGTGKTWFCLQYAYRALHAYKSARESGRQRPRIPILVQLRDFTSAQKIETLFSDFFFRKFEIGLPGYSAYQQLNRMGKLLLIFDGFDEMADRTNRQKQIDHFWQLARAIGPGAKAILTCRAEHFEFAKAATKTLGGEDTPTDSPVTVAVLEPPKFQIIHLKKLTPAQITKLLIKREGEMVGGQLAERILSNSSLADLAQRAGLIEFIIAALPSLDEKSQIDLSRVFLYATKELLLKNIREKRSFTSMADKVYFLCELAWQMLSTGELKINYSQFPNHLRQYRPELKDREIDHWKFDLIGQSLLVRDEDGNYSFSHKSLPEFFVAYKFAAELGLFAPMSEWITAYFPQSNDSNKLPIRYWHDFFLCPNEKQICKEQMIEIEGLPRCMTSGGTCMALFAGESLEVLRKTFGRQILTPEVFDFLEPMIEQQERLWELIDSTRGKTFHQVGYCGGNGATLLNRLRQEFKGRNLREVVISGADLSASDLTKMDLRGSDLSRCILTHTILDEADLRGADLTKITFYAPRPSISLAWISDSPVLATVGSDGVIHLWSTSHWGAVKSIPSPTSKKSDSVCWDPMSQRLYMSYEGGIGWVELAKSNEFHERALEGRTTAIAIAPNRGLLALKNSLAYEVNKYANYPGFTKRVREKRVILYDIQRAYGFPIITLTGDFTYPTVLRFYPEGDLLVVGKYNGSVQVFDSRGRRIASRRIFKTAITALAIYPNGVVICGSNQGEIKFFNYYKGSRLSPEKLSSESCEGLMAAEANPEAVIDTAAFNANFKSLEKILQIEINPMTGDFAMLDALGKLEIWSPGGKRILELNAEANKWTSMSFSPAGDLLALASNPLISILDVKPTSSTFGKCLHHLGQPVSCEGMLISGAKGLEAPAPSGKGTLEHWLKKRGALG